MSLIHRYQNNGYNIVLDINSGCIHVVDEVTYEVLPYMEEGLDTAAIVGKLGDQFSALKRCVLGSVFRFSGIFRKKSSRYRR